MDVNDIYSGILKPGAQGGIFRPGPAVLLPKKITSSPPLATRQVKTTKIDDNGNPISPLAGVLMATGMGQPIPGPNGSISLTKDTSRLAPSSPAMAFSGEVPALTNPALSAIGNATVALPRPRPEPPMMFSSTPAGPAPAGDPWVGMRIGSPPVVQTPGVVTSNAPTALKSNGNGSGALVKSIQSAPQPAAVTLASGKQSQVGATGSAQGGKYQYQVQADGSVKNLTTGRTTAPATR